jgi:hypothetical protein
VGVPPDEFSRDRLNHIAEGEGTLFLGHASVKNHLEQQVSEFVPQVRQIAALDGIHDLVGFLDRVRCNRCEILLEIPGTACSGRAQGRHDLQEACDVGGRLHG